MRDQTQSGLVLVRRLLPLLFPVGLVFFITGLWLGLRGIEQKKNLSPEWKEWTRLTGRERAPTAENLKRGELSLKAVEEQLHAQMEAFSGKRFDQEVDSLISVESLFFDLVETIEQLRRRCDQNQIIYAEDESFGFDRYLASKQIQLPEGLSAKVSQEWLTHLNEERMLIKKLVEALVDCHPSHLVAVERGGEPSVRRDSVGMEAMDRVIVKDELRIVFEGRTAALRCFLSQLMEADYPLVLRQLAVQRVERTVSVLYSFNRNLKADTKSEENGLDSALVIVAENESRFELDFEVYRLKKKELGLSDEQ